MAHFAIAGNPIAARALANGLYLVATPIGNLGDVTLRALETLAAADLIACEDTRVTAKLLRHYDIRTPTTAYHEHNAVRAGARILARLADGAAVALASDAGTPLISDPGARLVESARQLEIPVHPIPGPSAPIAAITGCGLPGTDFFFGGFLPTKTKARRDRLQQLGAIPARLVFFESPNRLVDCLRDIGAALGDDREVCVARELTKLHEEFRRGSPQAVAQAYSGARVRGEIVLVIAPPTQAPQEVDVDNILSQLMATETVSRAAALAAAETGLSKKRLYARALELAGAAGAQQKP